MPTEVQIDILPALIVIFITVVVIGSIKLFCMILEWDHKMCMEEFEQIMEEHKSHNDQL